MKINLIEAERFAKCPRLFWYMGEPYPPHKRNRVAVSCMKRAYQITNETGHVVESRRIMGWVDSEIFKNIDIKDAERYEAGRVMADHILNFLQSWRETLYEPEATGGYTDLSLSTELGRNHTLEHTIPIILPRDPLVITYVDDIETNGAKMYNDIKARGMALLAYSHLLSEEIILRHIRMGSRGGFSINEKVLTPNDHERTNKMLVEIAELIDKKVDYPARRNDCYSNCAFSWRCSI